MSLYFGSNSKGFVVSENRKKLKTWYAGAKMQQENYFKRLVMKIKPVINRKMW